MQCFAIPFKPPGPKIAKTVGYSNTTDRERDDNQRAGLDELKRGRPLLRRSRDADVGERGRASAAVHAVLGAS